MVLCLLLVGVSVVVCSAAGVALAFGADSGVFADEVGGEH